MTKPMTSVLADALRLDEGSRAELAAELLASLNGPADPNAERAWDVEIQRRIAAIEAGTVPLEPWEQVDAALRKTSSVGEALSIQQTCRGRTNRRWYEALPGLGDEFYDAVVKTIELIRTHPKIGTPQTGRLLNRQLHLSR